MRLPADAADLSVALDAIAFREAYGLPLDEAQKLSLIVGMAQTATGLWACGSFAHAMSRQNGKGDEIEVRESYGAVVLGERWIHTSHEYPTAGQAFQRMEAFLRGDPELWAEVADVHYANGEQGFEFASGGVIMYKARTGKGGRGFDAIDAVAYDEAQHIQPEHLSATSPTGATAPNFQKWWAGSAGLAISVKWWELRKAALRKHGEPAPVVPEVFRSYFPHATTVKGRTGYLEHTAETVYLDEEGEVVSEAPELVDPVTGEVDEEEFERTADMANPAYLVRISSQYLHDELEDLGPELYAREHLTVWDPLPTSDANRPEISKSQWNRQRYEVLVPSGRLVLGVAVDQDASAASIVAAELTNVAVEGRDGAEETIEGVGLDWLDTRPGTSWVASRLRQLCSKHRPHAVAVDAGHPDTRALVPELDAVASELGVQLVKLGGADAKAACAGFVTSVVKDRTVFHLGQPALDTAVAAGRKRKIGDGWVWETRVVAQVSPLRAATVAAYVVHRAPAAQRSAYADGGLVVV